MRKITDTGNKELCTRLITLLSKKVRDYTNLELYEIIVNDFSTTTPDIKIASEIVMLKAVDKYFCYDYNTMCGITNVTLTGTLNDWAKLIEKTKKIQKMADKHKFDLKWWLDELLFVLNKMYETREGKVDKTFWDSYYIKYSHSGMPTLISGWFNVFFPFVGSGDNSKENKYVNAWRNLKSIGDGYEGYEPDHYPKGLSVITVKDVQTNRNLKFIAGLTGVSQDKTTCGLTPEIGWTLYYENDTKNIQSTD